MSDKTSRQSYRFEIDVSKSEDKRLEAIIEEMKADRKFSQSIKEGLLLIADLRDGNLDVLFDLFPFVKAEFLEYLASREILLGKKGTALHNPKQDRLVKHEEMLKAQQQRMEMERVELEEAQKRLRLEQQQLERERSAQQVLMTEKLARIEEWIVQMKENYQGRPSRESNGQHAPRKLKVPQFTAPAFEEDDDDEILHVVRDKNAGKRATQNFLNALNALIQDD